MVWIMKESNFYKQNFISMGRYVMALKDVQLGWMPIAYTVAQQFNLTILLLDLHYCSRFHSQL